MSKPPMKIITVKQPWAHLIVHYGKDIENRSWNTHYRGQLLIHAGKGICKRGMRLMPKDAKQDIMIHGAIIGICRLSDVLMDSSSQWFEGPWGFELEGAYPIDPIYCKGQLGLWNPTPEIMKHFTSSE